MTDYRDHGLTVPPGWKKGEPLRYVVKDHIIHVWQAPSVLAQIDHICDDYIAFITFRTLVGLHHFMFWWNDPNAKPDRPSDRLQP